MINNKDNSISSEQLINFEKATKEMIATNKQAYDGDWSNRFKVSKLRDYSPEDIERIINKGSLWEQQRLSRNYFEKNGYYKRIISYYSTLYSYSGILVPMSNNSDNLSKKFVQKRYTQAVRYLDKIDLPTVLQHFALKALIEGCYYGVKQTYDKSNFVALDLPTKYCCSRFKNKEGLDLIEFDVSFFDTISVPEVRKTTLEVYPKRIRNWYHRWKKGEVRSKWVFVPADIGICFPFYTARPFFLHSIIPCIANEKTIQAEQLRELEDIKKIIVQKIPHLNDGTLLFEPDEAAVMHNGAVGMMSDNPNVSVLTSYADVDAIISKTSNETSSSILDKMTQNIYNEVGVSSEIFSANSNLALGVSIENDMAFMAPLINKFNIFVSRMINNLFGTSTLNFNFKILPITEYNRKDYAESAYKLATAGYSLILPAIAMGVSQSELSNLKILENDILELTDKLIPLQNSFGKDESSLDNEGGRPEKEDGEKSDKTEQNIVALEGGSN